jgi:hypothetical protein
VSIRPAVHSLPHFIGVDTLKASVELDIRALDAVEQVHAAGAARRPLNKARFRAPERSGHFRDALYSPWSV